MYFRNQDHKYYIVNKIQVISGNRFLSTSAILGDDISEIVNIKEHPIIIDNTNLSFSNYLSKEFNLTKVYFINLNGNLIYYTEFKGYML